MEVIEFILTSEHLPHSLWFTAFLHCFSSFPALSPCNLVCFHLKSVLFDASENVQSPVIPHWRSCFDDVIWLGMEFWQIIYRTIVLLVFSILLDIFSLLPIFPFMVCPHLQKTLEGKDQVLKYLVFTKVVVTLPLPWMLMWYLGYLILLKLPHE